MKAAYNIRFRYEYDVGVFREVTRQYLIPVTVLPHPSIGCFELMRGMSIWSRHFRNMQYIRGDFDKFKTSKECRLKKTFHKLYWIKHSRNKFCSRCGKWRLHINEYDTDIRIGFCSRCNQLEYIDDR